MYNLYNILCRPIFIKIESTKMPSLPFYKEFNEILVFGYLCLIWMPKILVLCLKTTTTSIYLLILCTGCEAYKYKKEKEKSC